MANVNVSGSIRDVLAGLEGKIRKSAEQATLNIGDEFYEQLLNPISKGGISPEDTLRHTYGKGTKKYNKNTVRSAWTFRQRFTTNKDTVSFEMRNRHQASRVIYGDEASSKHPNGYRSANPHNKVYHKGVEYTRPNQLTATKWINWYTKFKKALGDEIRVETRKKR